MSHEILVSWKSIPWLEKPWMTVFLFSLLILMALILWHITVFSWGSPIMYFVSLMILFLNLLPYFIVTKYELYEDRIEVSYMFVKVKRSYSDFGCFYRDKNGVMLSTFKLPRRLDAFRGQSLRFSKDQKEAPQVMDLLMMKIGKKY